MKVDVTKILLVVVILLLLWGNFFKKEQPIEIPPVTVTLPETSGTTGTVTFEEVEKDTLYIKGDTEYVEVDKGYKEKYEKAKDSLEKAKLYYQAIQIREYDSTIVDNDDISIKGSATTRGWLLDYTIDYTIKEKKHTYTPEVISELPRLTLGVGAEVGIPLRIGENFTLKANIDLMNKKGNEINLGYDTNQTAWLGYTKNFKLIK